jgi:DNA-binding transcriptional ArsR family regulator
VNTYEPQLDALGDATRRAILERLLQGGAQAVGKLADGLPVSRPAVSQHLRVLKAASLVVEKTDGTRHVYELSPQGFNGLREYFERFWGDALLAFKNKVEEQ